MHSAQELRLASKVISIFLSELLDSQDQEYLERLARALIARLHNNNPPILFDVCENENE